MTTEPVPPVTSPAIREPHYERVGLAGLGASGGVLAINSMAEAVSVAQLMAKSGIAIRKHLRDQPGACLGVLMQALRWEMDPYMVGNKSYAVNDQLAYEAQLVAAVVLTRAAIVDEPDYTYEGEAGTTRTCTVAFKMRSGKVLSYTTPEVKKITTKNSPLWKSDEDQQLGYFAIRSWARRHQPHVLLGVYTVEEAHEIIDVTPNTSGVASRLPGAQNGTGFDHESVQAEAERAAPRAGRAGRKPRAPEAEPAAAEVPPAPETPQPEPEVAEEPQGPQDEPTITEEPIATEPAPSAEPEPASPASATPASDDSPPVEENSSPSVPASDEITVGYPGADEVYMLNGDEWVFNAQRGEDRRDTYKNGEPFSDAGRGKHAIYEDHRPVGQPPVAENAEPEPPAFPPEFDAYITATETVETWADVKTAFKAFTETGVWKAMTEEQANSVRSNTWATLAEREVKWLPNHLKDISAFRMWIEDQDDPAAIGAALHTITHDEDYPAKPESLRNAIEGAAAARIKLLRA